MPMDETPHSARRVSVSDRQRKDHQAEALIRQFQKGDNESAGRLFILYANDVYRILYGHLGDDPDLEDLVQNVFIQVIRSLAAFAFRSRFSTWLYRIAVNVALQELRSRGRRVRTTDLDAALDLPDEGMEPWRAADEHMARELSLRILDGIAEKKRVPFILYEFGGYELKEIADITETSVETVKSRLYWARREFYEALDAIRARQLKQPG